MPKAKKANSNKRPKIYMDYAASVSANPGSLHSLGLEAKQAMEKARASVARFVFARPEEIIFTSGGTESNNIAIQGVVWAWRAGRYGRNSKNKLPHIITSNIEHPSVLETVRTLKNRGLAEVSVIEVGPDGIADPGKIKKAIKKNTVLVSIMYANNEIGTIQPIREIAKEIRHYRRNKKVALPFFHTDAVQAANYLDMNVERLGVDLLSLTGAKISGAGRVGVLYKRKLVSLENILGGGDQEWGIRPGTQNVPEIVKFSQALERAQDTKISESARLAKLRDYFIKKIFSLPASAGGRRPILNGDRQNRLPNNVNITFPKIPSDLLVIELSANGIMASSKSACKSSRAGGSYVVQAIRPELDKEIGGVRFSFGPEISKGDIDYTIKVTGKILTKLKKWYY